MTESRQPSDNFDPDTRFEVLGGSELMRTLSYVALFAGIVLAVVQLFTQNGIQPGSFFTISVGVGSWLAVRMGKARIATLLFCWGILFTVHGASMLQAGLYGNAWITLPISAMAAGWLLGARNAYALIVVNTMGIAINYALHQHGVQFSKPSIEVGAATYALVPLLGAVIGLQTGASFRTRFKVSERLRQELAQANADLEQRVAERSASLEHALADVKRMQSEMVESEKLASLGALVAGISHELNTPIGNALTVSSALGDKSLSLKQQVESGKISRSEMMQTITDFAQASQLVMKSLERSAELISSFKQVSIDQTSERRRQFNLADIVNDTVATLKPTLRKNELAIELNIDSSIVCDSYPGPLSRVVTNLALNARDHGYGDGRSGKVRISARQVESLVELVVEDEGDGMSDSVRAKAFEPFFTTRLGRGGSGLGLAICYRICTNVLGGQISLESELGHGTKFTIAFPVMAPGKIG